MGIECLVIAGIFMAFFVVFLRTKHKKWAFATLPLTLVPLANFILEYVVIKAFHVEVSTFAGVLVMMISTAAAAAWIGICSTQFESKKTEATYVGTCNLFNIALAAILISNILAAGETAAVAQQ